MSEAPKYAFNTNVFKGGVKLDMTDEELKAEEKQVEDLATYIIDTAIPGLIDDLKQFEGIPTDSKSLTDFMHKRGINMRYLGKVIEKLPEVKENTEKYKGIAHLDMNGDFKHVKTVLEREIVLRCAKHVFNRIIKDESGESELHLAQIISHLLNCLFAPTPFLPHLNSGKLKVVDESIQNNFEFFPDATMPSPRRNSNVSDSE